MRLAFTPINNLYYTQLKTAINSVNSLLGLKNWEFWVQYWHITEIAIAQKECGFYRFFW